ncbi:hypothetical protein Alches_20140 [Alicyclobacillus hesperidum subsp. aegles]|uniref:hypothetical protein n=1 Tax=Alicyclobacillus hesperidum TaxID=89784 RepID=UPI00071930F3|nr:hypothetical protein [Alicyclobacillus hesperidum]KRW92140.1 hypothetical protein SD51_04870 [Alicyclobacillus tengchongensis]GLG01973.1 hypothetical protein Alches_20140 [Alicyclobacillus hesperidum subsp. aegles]
MKAVQRAVRTFVLAFVGLSLLMIVGFMLVLAASSKGVLACAGGALMVLAMILAAAVDIRLRSPHVRKVQ